MPRSEAQRIPLAEGYDKYIGLEHLDSGSLKIKRWGSIAEDKPSFTRVFKKGHILFGKRRSYLKKAGIAEFDGICSGDIIVMEPNEALAESRLLPFIVQSDSFWEWSIKTSSGSLSPRTKFSALKSCDISIPRSESDQQSLLQYWLTQNAVNQAEEAFNASLIVEKIIAASWFSTTKSEIKHVKLVSLAEKNGLQTGPFGSQLHAKEYSEFGIPVLMPKELPGSEVLI